MKNIVILGSTGSIGTQTLEVCENLGNINVLGLSAYNNIELLQKQIEKFSPKHVCVYYEHLAEKLEKSLKDKGISSVKVLKGLDGMIEIARTDGADGVVNALGSSDGLLPTLEAIEHGKHVALANKETLVMAGELVMRRAREKKVTIMPIDSEHSAIFQCLQGNTKTDVERLILTASGGPFRGRDRNFLENVTVSDALKHPNWSMGRKITIDSATLANKALEVIEARWLFDVLPEKISVVVHPQSIIHSMVEFVDGSVMAQLGETDMRLPIAYALTYPVRMGNNFKRLDFLTSNNLTFEPPDLKTFSALSLGFQALSTGGLMPAVFNRANEVAVERFLAEKIKFLDIFSIIEKTMDAYVVECRDKFEYTVEGVNGAGNFASNAAMGFARKS